MRTDRVGCPAFKTAVRSMSAPAGKAESGCCVVADRVQGRVLAKDIGRALPAGQVPAEAVHVGVD